MNSRRLMGLPLPPITFGSQHSGGHARGSGIDPRHVVRAHFCPPASAAAGSPAESAQAAVTRDVTARSPLHVPLHPRLRRSARCKPSRAGMTCLALQASQHRPSQNVAFGYCTGAALLLNPRQSSPQIEQVRTSSPVTSLNAGASVARAVALRVRRRAIPRAVSG